jgi:hypothetical protein
LKKFDPLEGFATTLKPSLILAVFYGCAFLLGQVSLYLVLPPPWNWVVVIGLGVLGFFTVKKEALRQDPQSIVYCQRRPGGLWLLINRSGKKILVKLNQKPYRSSWLILLPFQTYPQGKKCPLILSTDSLPDQKYTLLLSRLWG